jgi:hypothetical protein
MSKKIIAIIIMTHIVAIGVGVYGGTVFEKKSLSKKGMLRSQNSNSINRGAQSATSQDDSHQSGRGGSQGFNRGPNGGGFVGGELISKDDKSITVKTPDGSSKIVFFSESTNIGKSTDGSLSDLNIGQQVMVSGDNSTNGTISAKSIQIRPNQAQ